MNYDYNPVMYQLGGMKRSRSMFSHSEVPEELTEKERPTEQVTSIKPERESDKGFVQRARLKILEGIYHRDKYAAVKSYVGTDANVLSITPLNIIMDNYIIVDVVYTSLLFDPTKIYYVPKESMKLLDINQKNKFITEVNGTPVAITVLERYKNLNVFPIKIYKTLDKNNENLYSYYGLIQQYPTSEYSSIISFPERILNVQMKVPKKLVDELAEDKRPKFSTEEQQNDYRNVITKLSYNSTINNVVRAKSINDIENHNNIGYIIDVNDLKPNIHGIVYCIQKRNVFDVLIIPDNNYTLTEAALKTLKSFMYSEYLEYVKFYE